MPMYESVLYTVFVWLPVLFFAAGLCFLMAGIVQKIRAKACKGFYMAAAACALLIFLQALLLLIGGITGFGPGWLD